MHRDEIELTLPGPKPKYARLSLDGAALARETRMGAGNPRISGKTYRDARQARLVFDREVSRRMHEGYVIVRDPATVTPDEPILECAAPGWCEPDAFDLSPDGRTLVAGANSYHDGPSIHLVDVATGVRRRVPTDPGLEQVHAVAFTDGAAGLIYSSGGRVRHLDLSTGTTRDLATVISGRWTRLEHRARAVPVLDAARRRVLVFGGGHARVLDVDGGRLFETPVTRDCRMGTLAPSGRLLALGHGASSLVEVWDVDTGERVARFTFPFPLDGELGRMRREAGNPVGMERLGFHPSERLLIARGGHVAGPLAASADTGEVVWAGPGRLCRRWSFTPDGRRLALGGWGRLREPGVLGFRDATTFRDVGEPVATPWQPARVVFSGDGSRMACVEDPGHISVHVLPA